MHIRSLTKNDADDCEAIVRGLPDWFGIEEGIAEARGYLDTQEGLVAEDDERILGFLTFASEFPESAEVTWMAVAADTHRRGIGRALVDALVRGQSVPVHGESGVGARNREGIERAIPACQCGYVSAFTPSPTRSARRHHVGEGLRQREDRYPSWTRRNALPWRELTVLPEHWDAANPCLFMVRAV